jgi:hypothetical protein
MIGADDVVRGEPRHPNAKSARGDALTSVHIISLTIARTGESAVYVFGGRSERSYVLVGPMVGVRRDLET